jgi:hypothetical protein
MFGTYERFNLVRAVYGRNGSNTYIVEDFYKSRMLRLGNNWTNESIIDSEMKKGTEFLFDIKLTAHGVPTKYSYFADEGSLKLESAGNAKAEIVLTDRSLIRIRGKNAGLRLELRSTSGNSARACRGVYVLPDGSGWEGEFGRYGKLFFKSITGNCLVTSVFDEVKNEYSLVRVDFLPDSTTGLFEAAVHDYRDRIEPFGGYEDFDETVEKNRLDFAAFGKLFRKPAFGYEEMAKYAIWTIWSNRTRAIGTFTQPYILFQNALSSVVMPWHQSYHAMAMLNDPKEAWRQICVMFLSQDERTGRLPIMQAYGSPPTSGIQPAFQGFALDYLFRKIGDDFIAEDEADRMYPKMAAWAGFWTTYRNAGFGDDVVGLDSPHDSGWDDCSMFSDGFPAVDPCANAFLVLLMEGIARIAKKSRSYTDKYDGWMTRAKKLTDTIINEYWDGERFVTKVRGKPVDSLSLAGYQPIMLGKRLPQSIIDKVAEKLVTEGQWLTEIGLASESMQSKLVTFGLGSFACGRVVGPQNVILTVGLEAAGKQKEAELIARRFCDLVKREGIMLGYSPYNYFKHNGEKAPQQIPPYHCDGWPWSPWTAACFLTMVTGIIGE